MPDVEIRQSGGPDLGDPLGGLGFDPFAPIVYRAVIHDGPHSHDLTVVVDNHNEGSSKAKNAILKALIAEAFRLGKEAR